MSHKLFLIDGTAVIYRAYFAFIRNPLINSKGQNTGAIFGTLNSFLRLVEKYDVKYVAISFDLPGKTFRHEITDTYKANRPPAPDDLIAQIEPIKNFFALIGLKEISLPGFEADDVLATLAEKFKKDYQIVMVTGDKDFVQLVDDRVMLYDPFKEKVVQREEIKTKYGLEPEQFIDYLALCGDASDNIPGVNGIGPKGAVKLLDQFRDLESIYQNLDKIQNSGIRSKLENSRKNAFLSQKLARIVRDVPLDQPSVADLSFQFNDLEKALPLLTELELNSITRKIKSREVESQDVQQELDLGVIGVSSHADESSSDEFETIIVDDIAKFKDLLRELEQQEYVALDTETTSQYPMQAELVGISLCFEQKKAYYLPVSHKLAENLDPQKTIAELSRILENKTLIAHNLKYDYLIFLRSGWEINNKVFDTMIADYLLHPTQRHSLAACAQREFGYAMTPIKELIGSGKKEITFDLVPVTQAASYAAADAWISWRLYDQYQIQLQREDLDVLFSRIELPLFRVLARIEMNGVYVDPDILAEISKKNQKEIAELTVKIYEIAGTQFNINSTQQLAKILFEDLEIKPVKKTSTGHSTDASVLEKLSSDHEIARLLLDYRQLNKLESTYVKALPDLINSDTGRIHSSFNQTVASTGRLSSSNPNLQNIPIRTEMGKEIRYAFTAQTTDNLILSADYSQIELRILAILSKDPNLIEAFHNKRDIHTETASIIYEKDRSEVTSDNRRFAKIINFGLLYGMGAFRISNELNIPRKDAQEFVDNYFNKFPTIKDYLDKVIYDAKKSGYVSTLFGRKLHLPEISGNNRRLVQEAERIATNMPIQGTAADLIKLAMIRIHEKIKSREEIMMIIQIHDELVFEVKKPFLEEARQMIVSEMEAALPEEYARIVPLTVDVGTGKNWFEAH